MNKSYGGYLPLELNKGTDYFSNMPAMRFNCANAAIDYILSIKTLGIDSIYLPYYMCPNICENFENSNIKVIYYRVGKDLLPEIEFPETHSCIYVADYFGIMGSSVDKLINRLGGNVIIADFCHAFYHKPVLSGNVFCIYSARKFFGVPDGAYLVNVDLDSDFNIESNVFSSDYSSYLIKSLEHGTDYSYQEKKEADLIIKNNKGRMSVLARRLLNNIDYVEVKRIRRDNAALYEEAFGDINNIIIQSDSVPYMYPLNIGRDIRSVLVNEHIYTPTLWGHLLSDEHSGTMESRLTAETVFLPVDQRYGKADISDIIDIVKRVI